MTTPLEDAMASLLRETSKDLLRHQLEFFFDFGTEPMDRLVQEYDSQKARETQSKP